MSEPLKILIVDDSIVFRKAVETALSDNPDVNIIGSVRNGEKALEFIQHSPPQLVTLDVEMPGIGGIETLKGIQRFNESHPSAQPIKTIMLSAHTRKGSDATIEALAAGAFDFIEKPEGSSAEESLGKLKAALKTKLEPLLRTWLAPHFSRTSFRPLAAGAQRGPAEAVAIGVSTGGPKALADMLPELCRLVKLPILVVQHMPPGFTKSLARQLDAKCESEVVEGEEGMVVQAGRVYIAPGGKHMCVRRIGLQVKIALNDDPQENGCRPSVDVLFRSVASVYGCFAVAAILTGMGNDGAKACSQLHGAGARIVAQDEETSVVWGMPGAAAATGLVERVEPLLQIPATIKTMCGL